MLATVRSRTVEFCRRFRELCLRVIRRIRAVKKDNVMIALVIFAVVLSVVMSICLRELKMSGRTIFFITLPGTLFMNLLKLLILPLITTSLLTGVTSLHLGSSKKLGVMAISYYIVTTFMAAMQGIALVSIIQPGDIDLKLQPDDEMSQRQIPIEEAITDLLTNIFSSNIVRSAIQQSEIKLSNRTKLSGNDSIIVWDAKEQFNDNTNFLGMIFFTVFFGLALATMGKAARPLVQLIEILNEASMKMILATLYLLPIGVFFLIMKNLLLIENMVQTAHALGWYMLTVLVGLTVHSFLVLPLIYLLFTRKNPIIYVFNMSRAMVTAFLIQSSSATLPVTFQCCEEKNKIDPIVTRFMLPIGAVINMDGTGLYEAIAAIFIAQLHGYTLSFGKLITISVTATLAAIGAATVPSAGLVTLLIVLTSAGLPTGDVGLLYSLDWLLDRFRTSVNVLGDAIGCGIVDHHCMKEIRELQSKAEAQAKDDPRNGNEPGQENVPLENITS